MRVLFVGDAVVSTGFAKATHAYCAGLLAAGHEVHVLGMHHTGDPHDYPYPIYTCWPGGDQYGIGRIANIVKQTKPDVIVIQQDPWNFPHYLEQLAEFKDVPVIGVVAVDGKNCQGEKLGPVYKVVNKVRTDEMLHPGLVSAIFWTRFGADEARCGGWKGPSTVIPLGVDESVYKPLDRAETRRVMLLPVLRAYGLPDDALVVGCVGRNQHRKRLDLTIRYFAEWVQMKGIANAVLWMHCAPTGDDAYDIKQLAAHFGVKGRVLVPDVNFRYGLSESLMAKVYNFFDVYLSTSLGEGFGLPALEAMACGTPCVLGKWSAYAEWAADAAWLAECISTPVAPAINTVGGEPGPEVIEALHRLYIDPVAHRKLSAAGIALAALPQYRWQNIGERFAAVVADVKKEDAVAV